MDDPNQSQNVNQSEEDLQKTKMSMMRIIWAAIMGGQILFLGVAVYIMRTKSPSMKAEIANIMLITAAVMGAGAFIFSVFIRLKLPRILGSTENLTQAYQRAFTIMIITLALMEGVSFFCMVQILIGQRPAIMLGLVGLAFLGQLLHFPTRGRLAEAYRRGQEGRHMREIPY
jgi:hypothetical protein